MSMIRKLSKKEHKNFGKILLRYANYLKGLQFKEFTVIINCGHVFRQNDNILIMRDEGDIMVNISGMVYCS